MRLVRHDGSDQRQLLVLKRVALLRDCLTTQSDADAMMLSHDASSPRQQTLFLPTDACCGTTRARLNGRFANFRWLHLGERNLRFGHSGAVRRFGRFRANTGRWRLFSKADIGDCRWMSCASGKAIKFVLPFVTRSGLKGNFAFHWTAHLRCSVAAGERSALGPVLCQLVKTMHSTFDRPQSLGEEIATVYTQKSVT